ncbi:orotate phosphoribosyltransferase [soil metagenome]
MTLTAGDVESIFRRSGALLDGHFALSSGKHADRYLEKFQVFQWPRETERLCAEIARRAGALAPATVAGPTTGGVILAHEVGRQLGARAVYAERVANGRGRAFRRGASPAPNERVLVVDDILSTGGSLHETIGAVRSCGATVVGAAVLADRSGGAAFDDVPLIALWEIRLPAYDPADCPQCSAGLPLQRRGTTPAAATEP